MQTAIFPSATLAEFYRFALLLTGHQAAAELVITETLAETGGRLEEIRTETNRQAWLAQRLRERCLKANATPSTLASPEPDGAGIEAEMMARHFHRLPEPGRSALALFYLELFAPEEIAQLLKMTLEELGATLAETRARLQEALRNAKPPTA